MVRFSQRDTEGRKGGSRSRLSWNLRERGEGSSKEEEDREMHFDLSEIGVLKEVDLGGYVKSIGKAYHQSDACGRIAREGGR